MEKCHFTEEEAKAKGGVHVRALMPFSEVPQGTFGVVIDAMPAGDGYDVCVQWNLPEEPEMIYQDWFSKDEYEQFLEEIEYSGKERLADAP